MTKPPPFSPKRHARWGGTYTDPEVDQTVTNLIMISLIFNLVREQTRSGEYMI